MKRLNKTALNKLRIEHNRVVKKEYRVNPANQFRFNEWFVKNYNTFYYMQNWPSSETYEVEIPSNETISGNPYILEVA